MCTTLKCDRVIDSTCLVVPQTKEDFPGTTKKLVDDIKTAGWEGGKVLESAGHYLPVHCALSTLR